MKRRLATGRLEVSRMKALLVVTILLTLISHANKCHRVAQAQAQRLQGNNMFPQWSHDGKKIVFTSDRDGDPEIYTMNADGSNPVRVTYAPGRDAHPYFSRDAFW
jgi:Tol biopolymer transport system component